MPCNCYSNTFKRTQRPPPITHYSDRGVDRRGISVARTAASQPRFARHPALTAAAHSCACRSAPRARSDSGGRQTAWIVGRWHCPLYGEAAAYRETPAIDAAAQIGGGWWVRGSTAFRWARNPVLPARCTAAVVLRSWSSDQRSSRASAPPTLPSALGQTLP